MIEFKNNGHEPCADAVAGSVRTPGAKVRSCPIATYSSMQQSFLIASYAEAALVVK
jgi:hypothetical protein